MSQERLPQPGVDYTSRDWMAFREAMFEAIPSRIPEWTSRSPNDFGVVMVELFAYIADNLSFYADRIANEAFLRTAVRRRSVLDIAKMLNYQPTQGSAAQVELQFEVSETLGEVAIPRLTRVSTRPDHDNMTDIVIFETDEELVLDGSSEGTRFGTVWATQGESYIRVDLGEQSDGTPGQIMALPYAPIVGDTVEVRIDEGGGFAIWREVDNLLDVDGVDPAYSLDVDEEETTYIVFGDGINGKIPTKEAEIEASFRVGGGAVGNVAENTLTEMVDTVDGVLGVHNPAPATGGADPESTAEIRINAPRALASVNRAVNLKDHEVLALQVPGIARASAEQTGDHEVTLYVAPFGGGAASPDLKDRLQEHLDPRLIFGKSVVLADPTYVEIDVTVDLQVRPTYGQQRVKEAVEKAVSRQLDFERVDIHDTVTLSQFYRAFSDIGGVDYGVVSTLAVALSSGAQDISLAIDEIPVRGEITINASGGVV